MSSMHPVLIDASPFSVAVAVADEFYGAVSGSVAMAGSGKRTRAGFQRRPAPTGQGARAEDDIRLDECRKCCARLAHELHDTLLQGFLGASMLLHRVLEETPADSPSKPALSNALRMVRRAIDEGRAAIRGLHTLAPSNLELAFESLLNEVVPASGLRVRLVVQGKPRVLKAVIQQQLFLIGREAVVNALRHSGATKIQVEVQYQRLQLHMSVRDNGCGMRPDVVQKTKDSHWGLSGMRARAEAIGARFGIWSRPGAGTEVRLEIPVDLAIEFASE